MLAKRRSTRWILGLTFCGVLLAAGCEKPQEKPPQLPEVTVATPLVKDVTLYAYYPGQLQAVASVDLRARVQGFLLKNNFKDGQNVKEGDLLFEIDPKPFEAKVLQCKGQLDRTIAANKDAEFNYRHMKAAYAKSVATDTELMEALTKRDTSLAAVESARADLETAQINLGYTKVYTPVSGQVSRHYVDVGNLVGAGENTLLGTVIQSDPIYVYFEISGNDLLMYERMLSIKNYNEAREGDLKTPVDVRLADSGPYDATGKLDYANIQVNLNTQTLQFRGILPNPTHLMIPGMFADVRVPITEIKGALLVPDSSIGYGQGGYYVMMLDSKNVVTQRYIKAGQLHGMFRVVNEGLTAKDRVITEGIQYVRVGYPATPKEIKLKYEPRPTGIYVPGVVGNKASSTQPATQPADTDVKQIESIETKEEHEKQDLEQQEKEQLDSPDKPQQVPATQKAGKGNV